MLNKVILMGRLTADPELRHTPSNVAVCAFTLAVNRPYSKEKEQATDFIEIVAWRNTAEFVSKYFTKGQQMAVCGRLQTRTWEDKQGNKRKAVEVICDEVHFAESKKKDELPFGSGVSVNKSDAFDDDDDDEGLPF